jgi:hypothetical protein
MEPLYLLRQIRKKEISLPQIGFGATLCRCGTKGPGVLFGLGCAAASELGAPLDTTNSQKVHTGIKVISDSTEMNYSVYAVDVAERRDERVASHQ